MPQISTLLFVGVPGGPELFIIIALAVLLFGASKLPKLARSVGQAGGEFHKGRVKVEQELESMKEDVTDSVAPESETEQVR